MQSIILLSGPIGAGKTTIAPALIELSRGPVAYIEGDTFWSFIAKGGEARGRQRNFAMVMRAMVAAAIPFAAAEYEVIVDFSIPPWFLEAAQGIAQLRDVPMDYVVLRPSEDVCAARAAARPAGAIADYGPYRQLYASFDDAARHIVADDTGGVAAIAQRIRAGLDAGAFRVTRS